jgi:hypothetical protein
MRVVWITLWVSLQLTWIGLVAMIALQQWRLRQQAKRTEQQIDGLVHLHRFTADMLRAWGRSWGDAPTTVKQELAALIARHQDAARVLELR